MCMNGWTTINNCMRINELLSEGEYIDLKAMNPILPQKVRDQEIVRHWSDRFIKLEARSKRMLARMIAAADPKYASVLKGTTIHIGQNSDRISSDTTDKIVDIDITVFWDAPDDVLAFWIGHELGHIALHYKISMDQWDKDDPKVQQQREFDADDFGVMLAQKIGYSKASALSFIYHKKSALDQANQADQTKSSHPIPNQRMDRARANGFYLSKSGIDQMNTMLTHLAE